MTDPRAEASRRDGARSCGPATADGRARSARNALEHGLRPSAIAVLGNEDKAECLRLAAALREELVPEGELQEHLADQIALASGARAAPNGSSMSSSLFISRRTGLAPRRRASASW